MKSVFSLKSRKGWWFWGSSINPQPHIAGVKSASSRQLGYSDIQDKDLRKIHKAAVAGDVARVQEILLLGKSGLNDQDKQFRTALHLAAACGHQEVVTLLAERKCQLNLCDSENRTALMKAVQCRHEQCAAVLLEHGADPNVTDTYGDTALHSAVTAGNTSIVEKLLSHNADLEARNKIGLTPLLIALNERKEEMAEYLIKEGANIHAVDKYRRTALMFAVKCEAASLIRLLLQQGLDVSAQDIFGNTVEEHALSSGFTDFHQLISQFKQEQRLTASPQKSNSADKDSNKDSLWNLSSKCSIADSCLPSAAHHVDFAAQSAQPLNVKQTTTSQRCQENKVKCDSVTPKNATSHEGNNSGATADDVTEILTSSTKIREFSYPDSPSPEPPLNPLKPSAVVDLSKEGATKPVTGGEKELGNESAPQGQINDYNLTDVAGRHKSNRSDLMSALEEEDVRSLWNIESQPPLKRKDIFDLGSTDESISGSLPEKHIDHSSGAADQREKKILSGQVKDSPGKYTHLEPAVKGRDSVSVKAVEMEDVQTFCSDWESTGLKLNKETCQRSWNLKVDDSCPVVPQLSIPNQSDFTAFGQPTLRDSLGKCTHLEPTLEGRNSLLSKAVEMEDVQSFQSDWDSTVSTFNNETPQRPWNLKVGDSCPVVSQSLIPNQSVFTAFGQTTFRDSPGKYTHLEVTIEGKDSVPMKAEEIEDIQTFQPDLSSRLDIEVTSEKVQERFDDSKNNHPWVEEAKKQHESSEVVLSENIYDAADAFDGFIQQRKSGKVDNWLFSIMRSEASESAPGLHRKEGKKNEIKKWTSKEPGIPPVFEKAASLAAGMLQEADDSSLSEIDWNDGRCAKKASSGKDKAKQQTESGDDFDDLTQSSEAALEDCKLPSCNYRNFMSLIEEHGVKCKDSVSLWKIQDAVLSYERFIELKKNHCELLTGNIKAMKVKVSELQKELSKTKETQSQIEHQKMEWKRECCNLRETLKQEETKRKHADMVQKKIKEQLGEKKEQLYKEVEEKQQLELKLRALDMELRTVRNNLEQVSGSDEREKDLLRRNHILRDEIVTLKQEIDKIKNQKQEKEKEYFDDIEIMKEKNHELRKMMRLNKKTLTETIFLHNQELNDLKAEVTTLSSKLENEKQNKERLETEVEACGSKLAVTLHEHDQTQAAKRDLELAFQKAKEEWLHLQEKMNFDVADLKANNEILSQKLARSENQFTSLETKLHHMREALREQTSDLKDAWRDLSYAQSQKKEVELMYVQEQSKVKEYVEKQASLEDRLSQLQSENVLLRERLDHARDMIAECSRLKESVCRYENEKTAREVVVKQLQQELVDTMKKQSMAGTSLELTSCCQINLEDEIQYVKTLSQFRSQLQKAQDQQAAATSCAEKMQEHIQKIEIENAKLKGAVKIQGCKIDQLQKNLHSAYMMDDLTAKPEPATSTWPHLDAENQFRQQELSVKATPNKYERLEKKKKKQKQVVVSWRSPMETNLVERCQDERDMRVIERTVQDIEEKVNKVSSLLQTQATSQNHLEQLIESHNTSVRSQMELSCKVLETELFKMKTEKNSNNIELEKYKHLYLEEVKSRECLENELSRMNKKLTEVSSKYMERMHNRCLLSTVATMPAPGLPGVTDLSHHLLPCIYPTAGQSSTAFPTSKAEPLNDGKGSYYNKMKQEFDRAVTKELREAVAEYEIESCTSSFVPTDEFKLRQDPVLKASEEYVAILKKNYMIK